MVAIPASARALLQSGQLAHLVTTNPDGSPQISIVWVGLDGDEIVLAHLGAGQKIKNIERDPRVALSIEGTEIQPPGLQQYLVVHGTARITEGGGPELLQELAHVYLGPDVKFPPWRRSAPGPDRAHHRRTHRRRRPLGGRLTTEMTLGGDASLRNAR